MLPQTGTSASLPNLAKGFAPIGSGDVPVARTLLARAGTSISVSVIKPAVELEFSSRMLARLQTSASSKGDRTSEGAPELGAMLPRFMEGVHPNVRPLSYLSTLDAATFSCFIFL